MRGFPAAILIAASVVGCAASSTASRQGCTLTVADSTYAKGGPVYRDCAVEHRAVVVDRSARPEFNFSSPPAGGRACYSAEVEFVVDESGRPETETATILHTNNPDFAAAVVSAIARWRYRPATIRGVPVRQIVQEKMGVAQVVVVAPAGQPPTYPARPPVC